MNTLPISDCQFPISANCEALKNQQLAIGNRQ